MIETKFKETEVGRIPEIWQSCEVGILCDVNTGSKNTQDKVEDGKYLFFVRSQTVEHINTFSYDCEAVLTAGDGVGTGKVFHYVNGKFEVHQRVYIMNNFSTELDGKYFFFVFSQRFYDRVMQMTAKSSVDSVRKDMINEMQIPLPPLPEQRRIASALSSVDELISSLDTLIEKKQNIKLGAMQQLLTGKKRLKGFNQPWVEKTLGEIEIKNGTMLKSTLFIKGNVPVIAGGKQPTGYHNVSNRTKDTITISGSGANAGYVAFYHVPIFASDCSTINEQSGFAVKFLFYALLIRQADIYDCQAGGAQPHIHAKDIKDITLQVPTSIEEQRAIAAVLTNMDNDIAALEQKRDKYITVKQGMMQQLLTGKIRLIG